MSWKGNTLLWNVSSCSGFRDKKIQKHHIFVIIVNIKSIIYLIGALAKTVLLSLLMLPFV